MEDILTIQERLQTTIATIARLEPMLSVEPDDVLLGSLNSLRQRQQDLEAAFLKAANDRGLDVCSYRLSTANGLPNIEAFSDALSSFQTLFSTTYDSVKTGPKTRSRLSSKTISATSLQFGYTYPGSIGAVFTLPNDRVLPTLKTDLDISMDALLDLAKISSPDEVTKSVREYGEAVVRAVYKWAKALAHHSLAADITWMKAQDVKAELLIQEPEAHRLYSIIEASGEEVIDIVTLPGLLVGADTVRKTFHMITADTETDIRGRYGDAISEDQKATIPSHYKFILQKTTSIKYSQEEPETDWFLKKLEPHKERE